jgi:hypothetical protein
LEKSERLKRVGIWDLTIETSLVRVAAEFFTVHLSVIKESHAHARAKNENQK